MDITICVTNWGRDDMILTYLIPSLQKLRSVALAIHHIGSDEFVGKIKDIIPSATILRGQEPFWKPKAINDLVEVSTTEKLFLCDADMALPEDFTEQYNTHVSQGHAWFPTCFFLASNKPAVIDPANGYWQLPGYGMAGILKEDFIKVGKMSLGYREWGGEDTDLYIRCCKHLAVYNEKCPGLFHHWHPTKIDSWRKKVFSNP